MNEFKIRCSAIGHIMGGTIGLTIKQQAEIASLKAKIKWTDLQNLRLAELMYKETYPELPAGAKTYCEDWLKGQLFEYTKHLSNKYLDKGNIMEDESLDLIADQLGYGMLIKNELYFINDYMHGTPDAITDDEVIDTKNSWDASTFPLFDSDIPNMDYYWQLQGYMELTGRKKAKLVYCLLNVPDHLIAKEARWYSISQGFEELDEAIYERFRKNLTYDNIDPKLRIKTFEIEKNEDGIAHIKERVIMCREYIETLKSGL